MSSRVLHWRDAEGHSGTFQPYVLEVPVSLWGRDLIQEMGFILTNEGDYSPQSRNIMSSMGYIPGKGMGRKLQGRTSPVPIKQKQDRTGGGFS